MQYFQCEKCKLKFCMDNDLLLTQFCPKCDYRAIERREQKELKEFLK